MQRCCSIHHPLCSWYLGYRLESLHSRPHCTTPRWTSSEPETAEGSRRTPTRQSSAISLPRSPGTNGMSESCFLSSSSLSLHRCATCQHNDYDLRFHRRAPVLDVALRPPVLLAHRCWDIVCGSYFRCMARANRSWPASSSCST